MKYYPALLDLRDKSVVIVGGGEVGERKAETLLAAGAKITIIAPQVTALLKQWIDGGEIQHHERVFAPTDIQGAYLVMVATDDGAQNARIAESLNGGCRLLNVADIPEKSNFIVPSIVVRGDLILAISTSGSSPALARKLRLSLEKQFGGEYALYVDLLKEVRGYLRDSLGPEERREILYQLIDSDLLDLVREGRSDEALERIQRVPGLEGFTLKERQ